MYIFNLVKLQLLLFPFLLSISCYDKLFQGPLSSYYLYFSACFHVLEAIESGRLPGDILDDIPCKYVDGTLVCKVIYLLSKLNLLVCFEAYIE